MDARPRPVDDQSLGNFMARLGEHPDPALVAYWRERIERHNQDRYAGVPISKFPEDLRMYETIIWESAPSVVIEVGVRDGGSALWFRDRLFDAQRYRSGPAPRVIAVDVDLASARSHFARLPSEAVAGIDLLEGDVGDPATLEAIRSKLPRDAEVFVVEDAAHDAGTTLAALNGLAPLVCGNGYYVVEDTCVDVEALRVDDEWPRGCGVALSEWLAEDALGRRFERRWDMHLYGVTCHPGGVLQRLPDL